MNAKDVTAANTSPVNICPISRGYFFFLDLVANFFFRGIGGTRTARRIASSKDKARGDVTTNSAEGYFSLLKRGVIGTFHHVSKKHLPLYLADFDARYSARKVTDGQRTVESLPNATGRRLTYKPLQGKTK